MGQLFLKDKDGLTQGFTIKGEKPSPTEQARIEAYLSGAPAPSTPSAPQDNTGIMSAFAQGVGSGWNQVQAGGSGLAGLLSSNIDTSTPEGRAAQDFIGTPDEWETARKAQQAEGDTYYQPQGTLGEQDGLYGKTRYMSYQLGQSGASTLGAVGLGILGGAAGTAVGGPVTGFIGGALGAGAASMPQSYEGNLQEQEDTYGHVTSPNKAFIGAVGQSALEGTADRLTLGAAGILGKAIPTSAKAIVRDATKGALLTVGKRVGEATLMGMGTEGATEAVQQAIQRWQADKPLGDEEAQREYLENAIVGGLLGGVTGGALGTIGGVQEAREHAKFTQIEKDLAATDTVGDFREQNQKAREASAAAEIAEEDKVSHPLLEDMRLEQDLISGPNAVKRPTSASTAVPDSDTVSPPSEPAGGKITPQSASPAFSTQEYSDAVAAVTGEKLVHPDKIKTKLKIGRNKANAIFNEMVRRGDGIAAGSKGQYLTVVDKSSSGDVETETNTGKVTRRYEARPITKDDVAPFEVRRAKDTKIIGPSFKTAEEAYSFADATPNLGDFTVTQNTAPHQYGVYEVTSGVKGQKPTSRFVKAFPDNQSAVDHVNSLNPQVSPETNQAIAQDTQQTRIAKRAGEMIGRYQPNVQALLDKIAGPGRAVAQVADFINAPEGFKGTIEGTTDTDAANGVRRIKLATDIFDANMSPDQRATAINSVAHHEVVHAVKAAGLFTPQQWNALGKRARARVAGKGYTYLERSQVRNKDMPRNPNMTEAQRANLMNEEAIAEMFRDYMRDPTAFTGEHRSMLRRLADFIRTLGQYARHVSEGNDVLSDLAEGKIGQQEAKPDRAAMYGPYYSSVRIPGFYLKSAKYFEGIAENNPDLAYPGQQWLGMLNPSKSGVKEEELQWLGLKDWLKDQKKVAVKDILEYIAANSIDIHEQFKKDKFNENLAFIVNDKRDKLSSIFMNEFGGYSLRPGDAVNQGFTKWMGEQINDLDSPYRDQVLDYREAQSRMKQNKENRAYHENTTQAGGEDYTEMLFHMPHLQPEFSVEGHYGGFPNVIATGRFKTRTVDGKKTLFVEEIQSDLHQQGKKNGYVSRTDEANVANLRKRHDELHKLQDDIERITDRRRLTPEEDAQYMQYGMERVDIFHRLQELEKVMQIPDAPFKTSWSDLVIKRLVRHAAETGHDAIGWNAEPEGVRQTERYANLEETTDDKGNTRHLVVHDAGWEDNPSMSTDVSGIVNFYTKRLANDIKKLFNKSEFGNPVPQIVPRVESSGADLNMEELFPTKDDFFMVMQELASYNNGDREWMNLYKKAMQLARQQREFDASDALERAGLMNGGRFIDDFNTVFPEYAIENTATATVDPFGNPNLARWSMDITPELKATALNEGLPLFSAVSKRTAPDTPEFRRWFAGSKIVGDDGKPLVLYHGTTQDFDRFDPAKGSPTSYLGNGFYFSDTPDDVNENYAGLGPDLLVKMQEETERRANEYENTADYFSQVDEDDVHPEVKREFMQHEGAIIPAYLSVKTPVIFDGPRSTQMTEDRIAKMLSGLPSIGMDFLNVDPDVIADDVAKYVARAKQSGSRMGAEGLQNVLRRSLGMMDALDPKGMDAVGEVVRRMFEAGGFDGAIMKDIAKRWPLFEGPNETTTHYIAFKPEQVKSVNNIGSYNPNDVRFMYSSVGPKYSATAPMAQRVPTAVPVDRVADFEEKITYNNIAPAIERLVGGISKYGGAKIGLTPQRARSFAEGTVFALQDVMQPLGKLIDRVRANGGSISNETDTYLRQQLMTGQIEDQINKSKAAVIDPLVHAVKKLNVTKRDVEELLARHPSNVLTVNGVPYEKAAVRNILQNYADPKLALAEVYLYAQHAKERNAEMRRRNANLQNSRPEQFDSGSGMSDFEANDVLTWFGSKPFAGEFADLSNPTSIRSLYRKLISRTNDIRVATGLNPDFRTMRDPTTGDPIDVYQDYAPLRGYTDNNPDHIDDMTQAFIRAGKRLNIAGKEDRSATGRASEASNLIVHAILQHDEAIVRGQKNKIGQTFLNMIRNNMGIRLSNGPNALPNQLSDFAEVVPLATSKPVYDNKSGLVRMASHPERLSPDLMIVKEGGKETGIRIKDDRLRHALLGNTMLGDTGQRALINGLLKLNRFLAAVRTSYNPEFLVSNFFRDFGAAQLNLSELQVKGLRTDVMKSVFPAIRGVYNSLRDTNAANPWRDVFEDFSAHGGKTAYMGTRDLETTIKRTLDELSTDPNGNFEKIKDRMKAVGRLIEAQNDAVENGIRVATYKHLVDRLLEMSNNPTDPKEIERIKNRAAYHAKNLTVNFNMGGSQKPMLNALYLFFNASLQGSAALVNPLIRSKTVRRIWLSAIAAGALQDIILSSISAIAPDGEKEYDKIPDYILETHMVFLNPFSESGYIKIPMPYLFNAAFNSGRAATRGVRGGYTPGQAINSVLGTAASTLNPWGGGGSFLNYVAPTVADPFVDLATNTNFMGTPIAPEKDQFSATDLPAQRYWNNTSPVYTTVANMLDRASGGDGVFKGGISYSPNQYEYAFEFLVGGAGATAVRALGMLSPTDGNAAKILRGDEVSLNDIPVVRRFVGNLTSRENLSSYIENRDKVLTVRTAMREALKDGDSKTYQEIIQKYPDEYRSAVRVNAFESRRRKIGSQIKKIMDNGRLSDTDKKKLIAPLKKQQETLVNQANLYMR